ncbi:MAG: carbon-nitrogen hydrolase family protein [Caulobacteraceae bacterium]
MRAACLQQIARDVKDYRKAWEDILLLIDKAAENDIDLAVLPECAYPAYYLGYDMDKTSEAMGFMDKVISDISDKARKYGIYVAVGVAVKKGNELYNAGMLFDRKGILINSCGKSNLWHFDRKWFSCGTTFDVVETDIGKLGMMICADGRNPEISRILALKGAEIIIDMANLTASGSDPSKLSNPQFEYMLPARALENGVWLIMADKVGVEADSVLYAGRSCIISPEGEIAASASSDKEEIIFADIDLQIDRKQLPERKPEAYKLLAQATEELPVYKEITMPAVIQNTETQASVVQFNYDTEKVFVEKAVNFLKALEDQDCTLIMFPQLKRGMDLMSSANKVREAIKHKDTIVALTGYRKDSGNEFKSTIIASRDNVFGIYDKVHADEKGVMEGSCNNAVIKTPLCNIGVMHDQEGIIPEAARCLMLGGADIILWSDNRYTEKADIISRTRASENKVYLARTSRVDKKDTSMIAGPDGRILASTFRGIDQSTGTMLVTALSKSKTVVPGTNVILDRKPQIYGLLAR